MDTLEEGEPIRRKGAMGQQLEILANELDFGGLGDGGGGVRGVAREGGGSAHERERRETVPNASVEMVTSRH